MQYAENIKVFLIKSLLYFLLNAYCLQPKGNLIKLYQSSIQMNVSSINMDELSCGMT